MLVLHLLAIHKRIVPKALALLLGSLATNRARLRCLRRLNLLTLIVESVLSRLDPRLLLESVDESILSTFAHQGLWWDFGRITNYEIVDVIIVDDVCDVARCLLHARQLGATLLFCIGYAGLFTLLELAFVFIDEVVIAFRHARRLLTVRILRGNHGGLL